MSTHDVDSLQTICLSTIVHNFDRFYNAFKLSKHKTFSSHLEIIQKLFGEKLTKMLYEEGCLKNIHLDFVINKYSTDIDMQCFVNCDSSAVEERIKEIGSVITNFSMSNIRNFDTNKFLKPLCKVQTLILSDTNCSDQSLKTIAETCSEIKELDVYNCEKVSDKGLAHLSEKHLPLEILDVHETAVTYKGVALILKKISTINTLKFNNVPRAIFEATGLHTTLEECEEQVFNLKNLVILNNSMRPESHLTAILKVCSTFCPHVKDLTVTEITNEEQLYLCSTFGELTVARFTLSNIVNPKICINELIERRGDKLNSLTLTSFSLSVDVLAENCPNLEFLSMCSPCFTEMSTSTANFPSLKIIYFRQSRLHPINGSNSYERIISSSPNLEELHIISSEPLETVMDAILNYPKKLTSLNFSNTMVTADFIENVLKKHQSLTTLNIDNSGISSAEYDNLMDLVDSMERNVRIVWADYTSAIQELYSNDFELVFHRFQRQVLKL